MPSKQARLANLRQLIQHEGAVSQLALRLQISPIYIYRVLDGKFNIGDSMARKIEDAYGFPPHWMDTTHGEEGDDEPDTPLQEISEQEGLVPSQRNIRRSTPTFSEAAASAAVAESSSRSTTVMPVLTTPVSPFSSNAPSAQVSEAKSPPTPRTAAVPIPAHPPAERGTVEETRQRIVSTLINTLDRLLASYSLEISDLEKARLLMKTAEAVLDSSASARTGGTSQKTVIKLS